MGMTDCFHASAPGCACRTRPCPCDFHVHTSAVFHGQNIQTNATAIQKAKTWGNHETAFCIYDFVDIPTPCLCPYPRPKSPPGFTIRSPASRNFRSVLPYFFTVKLAFVTCVIEQQQSAQSQPDFALMPMFAFAASAFTVTTCVVG